MDNVRILHGWTKDERKELEEAKDNGFLSVIALICSIKRDDDNCHALYEKYYREDTNDNNRMTKDIIDFYCGDAKFAEQKYYVHLVKDDSFSYFNLGLNGEKTYIGGNPQTGNFQTQFTKQEVEDINPDYLLFLEKVPVEELEG